MSVAKAPPTEPRGEFEVLEPMAPEPTAEYAEIMKLLQTAARRPMSVPIPVPRIPIPLWAGTRCRIWKQDPSVKRDGLGYRLAYLPTFVLNGPRNVRINTILPGTTPVVRNVNGDFLFPPNTAEADCVQAFAVVWQTLTMFERTRGGLAVPWAWNSGGSTESLKVYPRGFSGPNAFYSRTQKALKFGYFTPTNATPIFTVRSLDIVSHETGHAVLDGLKPGWLGWGNPPQTAGLHESFGDLSAIFLALSQLDQVEAIIGLTKADMHKKNFLAALAEQFGNALGRPSGLRNADNDLKLSEVSNEVHAISQVFTGAVYDILADIFNFEKIRQRKTTDPAHVLLDVSEKLCGLVLHALLRAPATGATYRDVVNAMLAISNEQGDPRIYRTFIRNRFALREVVVSPTPVTAMERGLIDMEDADFMEGDDVVELDAKFHEHPSLTASQDREGCCGTMQLPEYTRLHKDVEADLKVLAGDGETIDEDVLLQSELEELAAAFE